MHLAHSVDGVVRLRGFGIPDQARRQQSRVVLTLQPPTGPLGVVILTIPFPYESLLARLQGLST